MPGCRHCRVRIPKHRLLARAAQQWVPSRDRKEAVYATFYKQVLP
jgi:hypothetical protein